MSLRIHLLEPDGMSARALDMLASLGEVRRAPVDDAALPTVFAESDVVWLRLGHRIDARALGETPRCRVVVTPVTGLDRIDLDACAARGVAVLSLKGETAFLRTVRATAEHTFALLLSLLRRVPAAHAHVVDGGWDRDRFPGHELFGKTLGLVGVGRLGSIVAEIGRAFGMTVCGFDPRPDLPAGVERTPSLDALARQSDVVSVHASYEPATQHLLGRAFFDAMKPGAVLVNTARGGIVDDRALLSALASGRLAGAALDVVEGEPEVGRDHPLVVHARAHENLLLTPHLGGNTPESFEKTEVFMAEKLARHLAQAGARA